MHRSLALRSILPAALLLTLGLAHAAATGPQHALPASAPAHTGTVAATSAPAASGVYYEIFVRSFDDSNGDGIGDLNGITARLDYLKSLGVSGIWLMPINPSPSYHGYDVTDYYGINPQYGTMQDFEHLLSEAHKRGIKVIIDLVINHTSDQHPWFKAARDPKSPYHDWYSWAQPDTDLAAISATGSPAWHALAGASAQPAAASSASPAWAPDTYYLGIFTAEMPDLNYDTPAVRQEMVKVGRYWLKKGVDGFRLDAAQHVYFDFKSQQNDPSILARNLAWWSEFRQGMNAIDPHAYIVGEVTRDTASELAPWFKPLSAVFDFPLATRLIDSARQERNLKLGRTLSGIDAAYRAVSGRDGVDAPFLSNHDQDRVMSQLGGNAQHMRMAAALLLTLPGHPFIYYGEELGMHGVKPDPDIREPMRWNRAADAPGETTWKASTSHDGPAVSVQAEQADPHSLLHYYTMLIHWRSELSALRDGAVSAYPIANPQVAAYRLDDAYSHLLVVHNLSGQPQHVMLRPAPAAPFSTVLRQSKPGITLKQRQLTLPAYSTAILR